MNQELFPKLNMETSQQSRKRLLLVVVGIIISIIGVVYFFGLRAPASTESKTIQIPDRATTKQASEILYRESIIRSKSLFQLAVIIFSENNTIIAGDYFFEKPNSLCNVVKKTTQGIFGKSQVKITIPEGSTNQEIAGIISKLIPDWNANEFTAKAKDKEGYLFPETYFMFRSISVDEVIKRLSSEYEKRITTLRAEIQRSKRSEQQIIIMASLLEKEAYTFDEAQIISGILWKRFDKGMLLQVDAPFLYVLGKTSKQLTKSDLQKDGPYNTYTRKGLPVGPIGNPGEQMILAALRPKDSPYWFYLHDEKGQVYFAKNYEEHLQNKQKYLK